MRYQEGDIVKAVKTYKELIKGKLYRVRDIVKIDNTYALRVKSLTYSEECELYFLDKFEFVERGKRLPAGTRVVYRRPEADSYNGGSHRAILHNQLTLNKKYVVIENQRTPEVIKIRNNQGEKYTLDVDSVDVVKEKKLPDWF